MTLYGLLASLAWTASAVLCISRADAFAHAWLSAHRSATTPDAPVEIPADLVGIALGETEKWAQDQTLEVIRERYDKLKDWNRVRAACGVAEVAG